MTLLILAYFSLYAMKTTGEIKKNRDMCSSPQALLTQRASQRETIALETELNRKEPGVVLPRQAARGV